MLPLFGLLIINYCRECPNIKSIDNGSIHSKVVPLGEKLYSKFNQEKIVGYNAKPSSHFHYNAVK